MNRKGVKARVVLARGAMFEFPDDGRKKKKRYFNALDFLSPVSSRDRSWPIR